MSNVKLILNDEFEPDIDINQLAQLTDFSFDQFSPNPIPLENQQVEFRAVGNNPYQYLRDWIVNRYPENPTAKYIDTSTGIELLNGYVDLSSENNQYFERDCIYNLEIKPNNESFIKIADNLKLRDLQSSDIPFEFQIKNSDFDVVKYVISTVPDLTQSALLSFVIAQTTIQLANTIKEYAKTLADSANPLTSPNGIAKAIIVTVYAIASVASIYVLLRQLSDIIFSKIKSYYCFNVWDVMQKACSYLGYEFSSSLSSGEYKNLCFLAATGEEGVINGNPKNNPIPNEYSLLRLFEEIGKYFNCKLQPTQDRKVNFEPKQFYLDRDSVTTLDNLFEDRITRPNIDELYSNISIEFLRDPVEKNTYLGSEKLGINLVKNGVNSKGDKLSATYTISGVQDEGLNAFSKKLEVQLPYSRAYRKNDQTTLESLFNSIYDITRRIVSLISGQNSENNKIGSRLGFMLLDFDFVGTNKIFILGSDGKLSKENFRLLHSETSFNEYYQIESVLENQYLIQQEVSKQPICDAETVRQLKDNNTVLRSDGRKSIVTENLRDNESGYHNFTYRTPLEEGDLFYIPESRISVNIELE